MILLAILLTLNAAILYVVYRGLSAPEAALPGSIRFVLGLLVTYGVVFATLWIACRPAALPVLVVAFAIGSVGLHAPGLAKFGDALGSRRLAIYLLSVAMLAGLVYVFVPITIFLTSPGEIGLHLEFLLNENVRDAMVVVYVSAALYAFAPSERMRTAVTVLALGAACLALIYAYALPFGYPMMTGLTFEQMSMRPLARLGSVLADASVIVTVGLLLRWSLPRVGGKRVLVVLMLVTVSLAGATLWSVMRDRVGGSGGLADSSEVPQQPLRFAKGQPNTLIIFLDRFMGGYVESILESDPDLAQRLSGFVWYPRSLSAGENSIAGVHPMFGGYDYLPVQINARGAPLRDVSVEAFSILPYNFSRNGYHVNFVNPHGLGFTMEGDCTYLVMPGVTCTHVSPSVVSRQARAMGFPLRELSRSSYADLLVLLGSMRVLPYLMKDILLQKGPWRPFLDHSAGTTFRVWAELKAFPSLSRADALEPNLNIITNILPHEPYFMGEDCLPRQEKLFIPDEEVLRRGYTSLFSLQHANTARCTLLLVADYLDYLKAQGVYDNTEIVIVSDHGIVGPVVDTSSRAIAGGTQSDLFVRSRSVLLVKKRGDLGNLQVSEEFMPNAEVPRIVCESIGGCVNPYLGNREIAALGRDDPFYVTIVPWQFNLQNPNSFVVRAQLELRGKDPYDARGWALQQGGRPDGD